jgi:2-polyprenyl-3-methyl-5-hydroxy-6-metoxy-1,4-benzoquinol methylase
MPEEHDSTQHWDSVYETHAPKTVPADDEVGCAALAHFGDVEGRTLLDLGCGTGEYTRFFASRGAQVVGIDQSAVAIATLNQQCADAGIDNVEGAVAHAMDLERLGPFDLAFGSMILHHIEPFDRFVDVLADAMRPGGRAFFYENSAMSSFLVWCREHLVGRFGIPKNSDDDEFPLQPREIDELGTRFDVTVEHPRVVLTSLASGYLLRDHLGRQLDWVDQQLGRSERLRRMSYLQHVKLVARPDPSRAGAPSAPSTTMVDSPV